MSRIAPREDIMHLGMTEMFDRAKKAMGFTSIDALIMAHQPAMLRTTAAWIQSILRGGTVDPGLKRLMGYIVSTVGGCTYCSAHTTFTASFYGVDEDKMKAAWAFEDSARFTAREKAALKLARRSSEQPNACSDQDFEDLGKFFSKEEIVELVFTVSLYAFLNRFNSTMQTDLEEPPKMAFARLNAHP